MNEKELEGSGHSLIYGITEITSSDWGKQITKVKSSIFWDITPCSPLKSTDFSK
jgi:hypothetical protein